MEWNAKIVYVMDINIKNFVDLIELRNAIVRTEFNESETGNDWEYGSSGYAEKYFDEAEGKSGMLKYIDYDIAHYDGPVEYGEVFTTDDRLFEALKPFCSYIGYEYYHDGKIMFAYEHLSHHQFRASD